MLEPLKVATLSPWEVMGIGRIHPPAMLVPPRVASLSPREVIGMGMDNHPGRRHWAQTHIPSM